MKALKSNQGTGEVCIREPLSKRLRKLTEDYENACEEAARTE